MVDRKQLNLRLDNEGELLEEIKEAARDRNISLNQFVIEALRVALNKPIHDTRQSLNIVLDRLDELEKKWQTLQERMDKIDTRQILDNQLDKQPQIQPQEPKTYTDAEVAKQWGCEVGYIRALRLGKEELLATDRNFWELWKPVKGRAKWYKLGER
jgi:uncharacterized protein (DUF1778 family)